MKDKNAISPEYVNLRYLLKNLLRHIWIPILLAVSVWNLLSVAETMLYKPQYRSSAILAINSKEGSNSYSSLSMAKEMTQIFAEVFQSNILKTKVEEELGGQKLTGKITTSVITETNLLQINYECDSPEESFRALNGVLNHYSEVSDYLFDNALLETIKAPTVPEYPTNIFMSHDKKQKLALLGGICGVLLILAITVMDDSIQTASAAKDKLDGELYTIIPYEKRNRRKKKKSAILITDPETKFTYVEAFQNFSTIIDHRMRKHDQKVLLVTSTLENEGKSTISTNLALALADRGRKVLLVDCDFRKSSVYKICDIEPKKIKQDFVKYLLSENQKQPYRVTNYQKIDLAICHPDTENAVKLVHSENLAAFIEQQRENYDYIILDSAPMIISDTEALLKVCDTSLLVVRQEFASVGDINDSLDILGGDESRHRGYVLNYYRTLFGGRMEKHSAAHRTKEKGTANG